MSPRAPRRGSPHPEAPARSCSSSRARSSRRRCRRDPTLSRAPEVVERHQHRRVRSRRPAGRVPRARAHPSSSSSTSAWSKCPWYLPSNISTLSRPVITRATRITSVLACDADSVYCHFGRRYRRASSSDTHDRVLGRQQELVAARHAVAHGAHDRLGRVAAEHRHVGDVEVAVREPVDVGEPRAASRSRPTSAGGDTSRGATPSARRWASSPRRGSTAPPTGASCMEPLVLRVLELLDQIAVDRRGQHGGQSRRGGQGQNRTADTAVFSRVLYQLSYLAGWCRLESLDPSAPDGLRSRDLRLDRAVRTAGLLYRRVCVCTTPVRRGAVMPCPQRDSNPCFRLERAAS